MYAALLFLGRAGRIRLKGIIGTAVIGLLASITLHTLMHGDTIMGGHAPGGFAGTVLGEVSLSLLSTAGTYIVSIGGMVLVLLVVTDISLFLAARALGLGLMFVGKAAFSLAMRIIKAWREGPERKEEQDDARFEAAEEIAAPAPRKSKAKTNIEAADELPVEEIAPAGPKIVKKTQKAKKSKAPAEELVIDQTIKGDFQLPSRSPREPGSQERRRRRGVPAHDGRSPW